MWGTWGEGWGYEGVRAATLLIALPSQVLVWLLLVRLGLTSAPKAALTLVDYKPFPESDDSRPV